MSTGSPKKDQRGSMETGLTFKISTYSKTHACANISSVSGIKFFYPTKTSMQLSDHNRHYDCDYVKWNVMMRSSQMPQIENNMKSVSQWIYTIFNLGHLKCFYYKVDPF